VLLVMAVVAAVVLVALIGGNGHAVARLTGSVFGLVERVFLGLVLLWMAVAAVRLTRLPMLGEGR
jgi:hypothetical protein